jgi:hypothetical protein
VKRSPEDRVRNRLRNDGNHSCRQRLHSQFLGQAIGDQDGGHCAQIELELLDETDRGPVGHDRFQQQHLEHTVGELLQGRLPARDIDRRMSFFGNDPHQLHALLKVIIGNQNTK